VIGQGGLSPVKGTGQGALPLWHGVYYGVVSNNADPKGKNRAMLRVPQLLASGSTTWAVCLTPLQDKPKIGTIVAAMFIGGDIDYPCFLVVDPKIKTETSAGNIQPVGITASAGSSTAVAAADHVHTLANALESTSTNIQPLGTQAAGTSVKASRADHVHAMLSWITALLSGSGGQLELDSGTTGLSDNDCSITLKSKNKMGTGADEIDVNTTMFSLSDNLQVGNNVEVQGTLTADVNAFVTGSLTVGNGAVSHLILDPQMSEPPNYPFSHIGSSPTQTQFNNLVDLVNGFVNSFINHQLMS
jgi:hypothetical protein